MSIPKSVSGFLWHFMKIQPIAFSVMVLGAIIWSVNETFFPYFIKLIVNAITNYKGEPSQIYQVLFWPVLALVSVWIAMEIALRTQGIVMVTAFPRFRANIRKTVYDYVKQHSHEYFSNHFAGSIANKISDLPY